MIILIALSVLYLIVISAGVISWRQSGPILPPYALGGGLLLVWLLVFVGRPDRPMVVSLIPWSARGPFSAQPTLLIDHISWLFFLILMSLMLVYVISFPGLDRTQMWVLGLGCAASMGILAGNILTLLFSWMLVDMLQFGFHFRNRQPDVRHDQFVLSFAFRLWGPFLVVYAHFFAQDAGLPTTLQVIAPRIAGLLILASGVRYLLSLPRLSPEGQSGLEVGQLTMIHSMTGIVSILILIRSAASGIPQNWKLPFYGLASSILLICALWWVTSRDLAGGRNAWIAGWFTFISLAAVNGQEMVSFSWALAALLSGNILFLLPSQSRLRTAAAGLFGVGILGWPYTPLWPGTALFSEGLLGAMWAVLFGIFFAGGIRQILQTDDPSTDHEPIEVILHMTGVVFLAIVHLLLSFREGLAPASAQFWQEGWRFLLPAAILIPVILIGNRLRIPHAGISKLKNSLSDLPGSVSIRVVQLGQVFSAFVMGLFHILEGRGGLIWSLVGVFFLLSLLAASGGG